MFMVVTKKNASQYRQDLKDILALDPALSLPTHDEEVLLICDHPDYGLIGGARLSRSDQSEVLKAHFNDLDFIKQTPCLVDGIFFHVPADHPVHNDEDAFNSVCRDFYKGLYEALHLYANQYNLDTLLVLAPVEEYNDIVYFGNWSFSTQHKWEETEHDEELVLGILPFKLYSELKQTA